MKTKFKLPKLDQLLERLGKFKYAILIALLGVVLLIWPNGTSDVPEVGQSPPKESISESLELRLETAIGEIEGAGRTSLVLSWSDDGQIVYQTDTRVSQDPDSSSSEESTATVQTGSSHYEALVVQNRSPTCLGALVVCEGADLASVRLQIVSAVAAVTGLGADRITVVKMKS